MNKKMQEYQRQEIMTASPEELVTKMYDYAIQACHQKNEERVTEILSSLIGSLNFDYELSGSLYELYKYCQKQAKEQEFEEIIDLLTDIRSAWKEGVEPAGTQSKQPTLNRGFIG